MDGFPQTANFLKPEFWSANTQQTYEEYSVCERLAEKEFTCSQCGKGYQHKKNLIRHTKYECGKGPQFCCPFCTNRYRQKAKLMRHMNTIHAIVKIV